LLRTALLLILITALPAVASVRHHTSYSYFQIKGNSAVEIYVSLLAHAKGPSGHDAFATTATEIAQHGRYLPGKSCRTFSTSSDATFKISLPKLAKGKASKSVVRGWQGFSSVLKRHEEHHRALWLNCAAAFNQIALRLKENNCDQLKSKFSALWNTMKSNCAKQNQAFDLSEQSQFLKQPFIRLVLQRK
jgi:predicted secreted Zn-dependent protease